VIAPLNFEHFDHTITRGTLSFIKDADRIFLVRKIGLEINVFQVSAIRRNSEALFELGHMENIMNTSSNL